MLHITNKIHQPVKSFVIKDFGIIPLDENATCCREVCRLPDVTEIDYCNESEVQSQVQSFLIDMLHAAGLHDVYILRDDGIEKPASDLCVVLEKGLPIGAILIKTPDRRKDCDDIFDNKRVLGRLFDYMIRLRSFSGIRKIFGIITTFNKWRITWLPDAYDIAKRTEVESAEPYIPIDDLIFEKRMLEVSSDIYLTSNPL